MNDILRFLIQHQPRNKSDMIQKIYSSEQVIQNNSVKTTYDIINDNGMEIYVDITQQQKISRNEIADYLATFY